MGWFEGMIGGFSHRKGEVEAENIRQAELANARESRVYEALLNSPDDEIRSMAVTGLLDSAKPTKRKGGFKGWIGEMEANPALGRIKELMAIPVTEEQETIVPGLPSTQTSGYLTTAPSSTSSMAMPEGNAVTPGQPLLANVESQAVPPPQIGRVDRTTVQRPRQAFRTQEEQILADRKAMSQGDVEGEVAGLIASGIPEAEARQLIAEKYRNAAYGGSAAAQSIAGEVVGPDGKVVPTYAIFDRARQQYISADTGQPIRGFRPRQTAGAAPPRFGQDRESIARAVYGKNFFELDQTEAADVVEREKQHIGAVSQSRAEGTGAGRMNVPADLRTAAATGVDVGTTAADVAGQRVANPAERARREGVVNTKAEIQRVKELLAVLPRNTDLVGGIAPGLALAYKRRDPKTRAQVAALESALASIVNVVARSAGEQRGSQTEADANRAYQAMVNLQERLTSPMTGDTQESALARIAETEAILDRILQQLPAAPVPGAAAGGTPSAPPVYRPAAGAGGPPPGAGPAANLDAVVPGLYVDDNGNLVQR